MSRRIYFYNSITGKKEEFKPENPDEVKIYSAVLQYITIII